DAETHRPLVAQGSKADAAVDVSADVDLRRGGDGAVVAAVEVPGHRASEARRHAGVREAVGIEGGASVVAAAAEHVHRRDAGLAEIAELIAEDVLPDDALLLCGAGEQPDLHALEQVPGDDLEPRASGGDDVRAVGDAGAVVPPLEDDGVGARL